MFTRGYVAVAAFCSMQCTALANDVLSTHPKEPDAVIFESGDIGGRNAFAKAKVNEESARIWCENWRPSEPANACAFEIMENETSRTYEAKANCFSGELTSVFGDRYTYDGLWQNTQGGMWDGWARFRKDDDGSVVGTDNASGGISFAAQWRTLCPYGAPLDSQPLKMVLKEDDYSGFGEIVGHNGSGVLIDSRMGTISYRLPNDSLSGIVKEGTLLFRGAIIYGGPVEGMAFSFKKGCDPASYKVEGYFDYGSDKLVLAGKVPVRDGCEIVGYAKEQSRLVFDLPHH